VAVARTRLNGSAVPLAIVFLAFGLRVFRLGTQSFWGDEGATIWRSTLPLPQLLAEPGTHPPLYYVVMHYWLRLGTDEFASRFLSALAGTITVAAIWWIGTKSAGRSVGNVAALLLALSPVHVWYSQEVTMYALTVALATLAVAFFVAYAYHASLLSLGLSLVLTALSVLIDHTAIAVWVVEVIIAVGLLATEKRRQAWTVWVAAQVGLAFALHSQFASLIDVVRLWRTGTGTGAVLGRAWERLPLTLEPWSIVSGLLIAGLVLSALAIGLFILVRRHHISYTSSAIWVAKQHTTIGLLFYLGIATLSVWIGGQTIKRHLLVLLPLSLLLAACSLVHLWSRAERARWRAVLILGIAAPALIGLGSGYWLNVKDQWRDAAAVLESRAAPTDVIWLLSDSGDQPFRLYYHGQAAVQVIERVEPRPDQLPGGSGYLWLIASQESLIDPDRVVSSGLNRLLPCDAEYQFARELRVRAHRLPDLRPQG
jgi:mannosyltransferase